MGKKSGGSSQPQQVESKTYQSRLPEYAAPYYHNLVGRSQALSYEDYIPYKAARVAGFSPEQLGAQEGFKAIAQRGMPLMDTAGDVASYASQAGPMMTQSGYQAGPIQSQYGGSNIQSRFRGAPVRSNYRAGPIRSQYAAAPIRTGVQGFGPQDYMRAARGFDDRSAQKYMNPYLSNVLDRQQSRATDRFNEQRAARNQRAIQSGAFGGSRQAIADSVAQREMNQSLQDMEAKGLSDAFTQAQSQFQRDRDARFKGLTSADAGQLALAKQRSGEQIATEEAKRQAAAQNLQAQIAQQKAFEAAGGQSLQAQIARGKFGQAAGQMDLEGQMARDKSYSTANQQMLQAMIAQDKARQTQGSQDLQSQLANQKAFEAAMGRGLKGSQVLAGLTKGEQDLDMQRLKALSDVGSQRQAMMQRAYDTQYEDFLTQREYPYQQLERFSAILQGMPTRPDISERMYTPQANPMGQMLQTGLGAYGAFKGMGGG